MRPLLDTVNRLPLGARLETRYGWTIVNAVTPDPREDRPHRLRVDGTDADSGQPEPVWFEPGEIVHFYPPAN